MRFELWFGRTSLAALVVICWSMAASRAVAQDAAEQAQTQSQEDQDASAAKASDADDAYAVPEGTPEELLAFVGQLLNTAPPDRSAEGVAAHREKLVQAAITATTRVMESSDATPEQAARAAEIKLQMLSFLARSGEEAAEKQLEVFKEQIRTDDRPAIRMVLMPQELLQRLAGWRELDDAGKEVWMADLLAYLKEVELDAQDGALVAYAMNMLNRMEDKEAATELVNNTAPIFEASEDKDIASFAERLQGSLRFMNLEGSQMQIEGKLLGGEPFDWSQYKDKVVLVDFWATWCGPCIQELPNVVDNYQQYHGKGFEVIGISLDTDAEKVKEFVAEREIPWPILFSDQADATGWYHPMAVEYGIQAIPAAVLVDKSGKVVNKSARGEALGQHLQELLGDPLPVAKESTAELDDPTKKSGG